MNLDQLARDAGAAVRDQVATIEPPTPGVIARRSRRGRMATGVAAIVALALAGVGLSVALQDDPAPTGLQVTDDPDALAPLGPAANGWVAFDADESVGSDIYLVRPGEDAHRIEVAGSDTADEACPAWSPDGTRLAFGRVTGSSDTASSDAELVIVPVDPDGAIGTPTVIALDGFDDLGGFGPHPCATWAPDGRWVAFGGTDEVWVVDTDTGAIRHLPDLRPIDLEWRPGTDELTIAGDMGATRASDWRPTPVTVYSVSTGELRQLGSVRTGNLTWSPDGTTLAYNEASPGESLGLWLVDADGTNERLLLADPGTAIHGIGPVWSPTGDRIAYQRLCCQSAETHEVVLVSVDDGTETVIEPPQTDGPNGPVWWYPYRVTWSPDGTTLLYTAWSRAAMPGIQPGIEQNRMVAVPADTPSDVTVLDDSIDAAPDYTERWIGIQMWGRQPECCSDDDLSTTTTAAGDDDSSTVAQGEDVEPVERLDPQTVYLDAEEQDGEVTGEFRVNDVVVTIQCSNTDNLIPGEIRLVGEVTANPDGRRLRTLHDGNDGGSDSERLRDGDLVALVSRDRGLLYTRSSARSCTELLESIPNLDGGYFHTIPGSNYTVETGEGDVNP